MVSRLDIIYDLCVLSVFLFAQVLVIVKSKYIVVNVMLISSHVIATYCKQRKLLAKTSSRPVSNQSIED